MSVAVPDRTAAGTSTGCGHRERGSRELVGLQTLAAKPVVTSTLVGLDRGRVDRQRAGGQSGAVALGRDRDRPGHGGCPSDRIGLGGEICELLPHAIAGDAAVGDGPLAVDARLGRPARSTKLRRPRSRPVSTTLPPRVRSPSAARVRRRRHRGVPGRRRCSHRPPARRRPVRRARWSGIGSRRRPPGKWRGPTPSTRRVSENPESALRGILPSYQGNAPSRRSNPPSPTQPSTSPVAASSRAIRPPVVVSANRVAPSGVNASPSTEVPVR